MSSLLHSVRCTFWQSNCYWRTYKGVGRPSQGPDVVQNMLCLCPNHHAQFDRYSFYIDPDNYEIKGLQLFENKKIFKHQKHNIDSKFLRYHFEQYKKRI